VYAQTLGNMPEYVGRVRQVGLNVLPIRWTTHSYYIPSQAQSQNPRHATVSQEFIDRPLEVERAEMDALLVTQTQMVVQLAEKDVQL